MSLIDLPISPTLSAPEIKHFPFLLFNVLSVNRLQYGNTLNNLDHDLHVRNRSRNSLHFADPKSLVTTWATVFSSFPRLGHFSFSSHRNPVPCNHSLILALSLSDSSRDALSTGFNLLFMYLYWFGVDNSCMVANLLLTNLSNLLVVFFMQ
ncbi:unnamed protein product [Schistosoma rodhaini]|uniref:Uncharacterized protein n=1 Tax=Schistosoma rodhaini TaxID=6188 RepID=A0AA85FFT5_9TREM|nr:unnamed protein product [Schistosoma rodhaini]